MRILFAAGLAGLALVSLAACNKSGPAAGSASSTAANGAGPAGQLTADQIPHRRPGLWTQTITMDGATPTALSATKLCVDAASEAKMSVFAQKMVGAQCTTPQISRNLDGTLAFSESCDMGTTGKIQSTGTVKGDFNSGYTTTIATTTTGSPEPSMNGVHNMVITATWTGPCAAGQKGGDMIMANGMTINVLDAQSVAAPAPAN